MASKPPQTSGASLRRLSIALTAACAAAVVAVLLAAVDREVRSPLHVESVWIDASEDGHRLAVRCSPGGEPLRGWFAMRAASTPRWLVLQPDLPRDGRVMAWLRRHLLPPPPDSVRISARGGVNVDRTLWRRWSTNSYELADLRVVIASLRGDGPDLIEEVVVEAERRIEEREPPTPIDREPPGLCGYSSPELDRY